MTDHLAVAMEQDSGEEREAEPAAAVTGPGLPEWRRAQAGRREGPDRAGAVSPKEERTAAPEAEAEPGGKAEGAREETGRDGDRGVSALDRALEAAERARLYLAGGAEWALPSVAGEEETEYAFPAPAAGGGEMPLLAAVRKARRDEGFVRGERRAFSVTLLEAAERSGGSWSVEELDRRVERDARRYDGGFPLY